VMLERPGLREATGQVRGEEKDPFPILGTLYAVRGLVRFGRKERKSTVRHQSRSTERLEAPKVTGYS